MLIVFVDVQVKPEAVAVFRDATLKNAKQSAQEPGIARFDVVQDRADPQHFVLVEVYRDDDAPQRHKETPHYRAWRDAVEPMMAAPRRSTKFSNLYPDDAGW